MALKIADANGAQQTVPTWIDAAYSYAPSATFTPVATPTAMIVIQGAASTFTRVKRIALWGTATASGQVPIVVAKRSTAGTLGSAVLTAVTAAPHSSASAASAATVSTVGTANYTTLGTIVGYLGGGRIYVTASGTPIFTGSPVILEWGNRFDAPPMLLSATEFITIDGLGGPTLPTAFTMEYQIELEVSTVA